MRLFRHHNIRLILLYTPTFFLFFLLVGCAGKDPIDIEGTSIDVSEQEVDPYEGFNRKSYAFNQVLDAYLAEPVSDAYLWVTPEFMQLGISNFFNNLKDVNVVLNDLMQGKFVQGGQDVGRILLNTAAGLGGLIDVASSVGLEKHDEDFGQTLAVWGVPQGPYIVLPVIGPITGRGVPGAVFDTAANPTSYIGYPVHLLQMLNARATAQGSLRFIDEAALDPYIFTRESFLQYRNNLIYDGNVPVEAGGLDFDDEFYDDDFAEEGSHSLSESEILSGFSVSSESQKKKKSAIDKRIEDMRFKLELKEEKKSKISAGSSGAI
ncbi:MAG: VacJ family lipoprotein [Methylococcales bacterium]|nr:VacJ family lipoprotein [Methylococcales bacterium]